MNDPPNLDDSNYKTNKTKKQSDDEHTAGESGSATNSKNRSRIIPIVTTPKRGISGASSSDDEDEYDDINDDPDDPKDEVIVEGRRTKIPSFHNSQGSPVRGSSEAGTTGAGAGSILDGSTTTPGSSSTTAASHNTNSGSSSATSSSSGVGASAVSADQERQILLLMLLAQVCALHDPTPRTFTVHVLELFERGILGRQSIHFLFELGLVPSNTPRLLPPSTTTATTATRTQEDGGGDSKETEILDLAAGTEIVPSSPTTPTTTRQQATSPQTLRSQEASAIRMHLEHLDLTAAAAQQQRQQPGQPSANLIHETAPTTTTTLVESPKSAAAATAAAGLPSPPNRSSWAVEHHPLSLSRYQREFLQVRLLNSGAFGSVFLSTNKIDLKDYAVKRVAFSSWGYSKDSVSQVIREVHCLAQCDHPNVVRYYTSWLEPSWMTGSGATTTNSMMAPTGAGASTTKAEVRRQQKLLTDINQMMVSGAASEHKFDPSFSSTPTSNNNQSTYDNNAGMRNRKFSIGSSMGSHSSFEDSGASSYDETSSDEGEEDYYHNNSRTWSSVDDTTTNHGEDSTILFEASSSHPKQQQQQREIWESSSSRQAAPHPRGSPPKKKAADAARIKYRYQIALFIQMQLCHPATLGDWIRHRNAQCPDPNLNRQERVEVALGIFSQIVSGLVHIHKKNIIHRDLKPHNLFRSLEDDNVFLIGDFGLSKLINSATHQHQCTKKKKQQQQQQQQQQPRHSPVVSLPTTADAVGANSSALVCHQAPIELTEGVGTASYAAPEQVTTKTYGKRADIFSLGLILLELICCFTTEHERMQTFYDCRHRRDIPKWILDEYPVAGKAILDCTDPNPARRPSAEELLALDLLPHSSKLPVGEKGKDLNELKVELKEKNEQILAYQQQLREKDDEIANLRRELEQYKHKEQQ